MTLPDTTALIDRTQAPYGTQLSVIRYRLLPDWIPTR